MTLVRRLRPAEIEAYDHVDPDVAGRVRVARIPALPGRYLGITLGSVVFLAQDVPDDGSSALLAHELVHVRQWREQGRARFAAAYVGAFATNLRRCRRWHQAYRDIPAEVEARTVATQWAIGRSDADRRNL